MQQELEQFRLMEIRNNHSLSFFTSSRLKVKPFLSIENPFGDNIHGNQFIYWCQQNYEVAVDLTKNANMRKHEGIHT